MLQNLEILAREAKSWPFEQARNLLAHVLKKRLGESERAEARALIDAGKADEALAKFEALQTVLAGHDLDAITPDQPPEGIFETLPSVGLDDGDALPELDLVPVPRTIVLEV